MLINLISGALQHDNALNKMLKAVSKIKNRHIILDKSKTILHATENTQLCIQVLTVLVLWLHRKQQPPCDLPWRFETFEELSRSSWASRQRVSKRLRNISQVKISWRLKATESRYMLRSIMERSLMTVSNWNSRQPSKHCTQTRQQPGTGIKSKQCHHRSHDIMHKRQPRPQSA